MCKSREKIISSESRFCELTKLIYWVQKFLIFSRINTTITVSYPKGVTWHFIETRAIKHDYYSSIIMWTHNNSKGKYWVVSQQALFFNAFLARHDDDNDALIKDKDWNITGASWSIWLVRESWIRGCPDGRTMTFGRTPGLWRYKIEDFVPCPDKTFLGVEGKLGNSIWRSPPSVTGSV